MSILKVTLLILVAYYNICDLFTVSAGVIDIFFSISNVVVVYNVITFNIITMFSIRNVVLVPFAIIHTFSKQNTKSVKSSNKRHGWSFFLYIFEYNLQKKHFGHFHMEHLKINQNINVCICNIEVFLHLSTF